MQAHPCDCGSGLRAQRCCRLSRDALPGPQVGRHLQPLLERASQSFRQGATAAAERLCLELLELLPGQAEGLWLLSRLRESEGKHKAVEALVRRIVALHPDHRAATQDLALRLMRRGAFQEAEQCARSAVRIAPQDAQSHNVLAMILTERQQLPAGEFHYRRVMEVDGKRDPIVLANLAWCLKQQGRLDEARSLYEESLAAAPDVLQTLLGFARLEEADRRFARASALLVKAETIAPAHPAVRLSRAVLHGRLGNPEKALNLLAEAEQTQEGGLGPEQFLEKGRLLDRLGRYEMAFEAFTSGKALGSRLGNHHYPLKQVRAQTGKLRQFFIADRLNSLPRAERRKNTTQPLFILGFPRSGTTLVEQMLTMHPNIVAGDELPFIHDLAEFAPRLLQSPYAYPEALAELWMGDRQDGLESLRDVYLRRASQRGLIDPRKHWFTDKMPLNESHLGLIHLLFPESPLLYLIRHPLDVVLSVFSNSMTHGSFCAYQIETAAWHYRLVSELVAHYRAHMPLRLLTVRYEDVVADPQAQTGRMLAFLDETFHPACLSPHKNRRYARTASYAQVTEPIHAQSVGRWRNYRDQLKPAMRILEPVIESLGYRLE